jgi:hypothetical protein
MPERDEPELVHPANAAPVRIKVAASSRIRNITHSSPCLETKPDALSGKAARRFAAADKAPLHRRNAEPDNEISVFDSMSYQN